MSTSVRVVVRFAVLLTLLLALSLTQGWASTIGSSTTSRSFIDVSSGQVYIYAGGFLPVGDTVTDFNWFGHLFSGTQDLTPVLFQDNSGVFTVVGIGTGQAVTDSHATQTFVYTSQAGTAIAGTNFTFGFVTGLVSSSGVITTPSTGSVDFNSTVDGGTGTGGLGTTNDWVFTPTDANVNVTLGTTFGANSTFALNSGSGSFNTDRTYSANVDTAASGVAEPGTFSLITGAGLVLAGLFRYRRSRGRNS